MKRKGFKCTTCSYSFDKNNPDGDTACIDQPEIYTGNSILTCRDYCVVRETYDVQRQKVTAFWRSCADKDASGYCESLGTELKVCFYSCQSDLCVNWVRGNLHDFYGDVAPPKDPGDGATRLGTLFTSGLTVVSAFTMTLFFVM
ncbi:uncharacterized protein LOC101847091 [Aplysia californica]|uniref:Uncharacterized protein LOC101847091 n=1 Tax=Aplysia californica TaxID=6500 RepID=A0ABM0JHZ3_APLCA|nr:uncharacterized protein LOC101847091 [Aplysia californica]